VPKPDATRISKADAIAQLAKWHIAETEVRATYRAVTGTTSITGKIRELDHSAIKIAGIDCEMLWYFRETSEYEYEDAREPETEANKERRNKYPIVIDVKFSTGEHLSILECVRD